MKHITVTGEVFKVAYALNNGRCVWCGKINPSDFHLRIHELLDTSKKFLTLHKKRSILK